MIYALCSNFEGKKNYIIVTAEFFYAHSSRCLASHSVIYSKNKTSTKY